MSVKTIALEASVYDRLARQKRPSESFTKTIARLLNQGVRSTCGEAVADSREFWSRIPSDAEADQIEKIIRQNRLETVWDIERPE